MGISINGATRLMGVIGCPIKQARTPDTINPLFAAKGANIVCVPMHISAEDLPTCWAALRAMPNLVGFGITLPHKQAALELCDHLDPVAERVGAVNLVRREKDGSFKGYQFDGQGFVRGLDAGGINIAGRNCLIVGAGGASVAIAFALAEAGVTNIVITNRTRQKAAELAAKLNNDLGRSLVRVGDGVPVDGQLVINATSLGLSPNDPMPIDPDLLRAGMTVAEVIAEPEITPLLKAARSRGVETHSGLRMIQGQVSKIADHICEIWGAG